MVGLKNKLNKRGDISFDWVVILIILLIGLFLIGYFVVTTILHQQQKVYGADHDLMYMASVNEVQAKMTAACRRAENINWNFDQFINEYNYNIKPIFDNFSLPISRITCKVMRKEYGLSTGSIFARLNTNHSLIVPINVTITNIGNEPIHTDMAVFSYNNSAAIIIPGKSQPQEVQAYSGCSQTGKKLNYNGISISDSNPLPLGEKTSFIINKSVPLLNITDGTLKNYTSKRQYKQAEEYIKNKTEYWFGGYDKKNSYAKIKNHPYVKIDPSTGEIKYYVYVALKDVTGDYVPVKTIVIKK